MIIFKGKIKLTGITEICQIVCQCHICYLGYQSSSRVN